MINCIYSVRARCFPKTNYYSSYRFGLNSSYCITRHNNTLNRSLFNRKNQTGGNYDQI